MCTQGHHAEIKIGEDVVKQTKVFTYLGSKISNCGKASQEITCRIGKARTAFGKLINILTSKSLKLVTRLQIYNATTLSILLYDSETWQLYASEIKKLNAFHRGCLRKILGITYKDRVTNIEVLRRTGARDICDVIRERRLRWFGHVARMKGTRFPNRLLNWRPAGKRKRGRPMLSWSACVRKDLKQAGLT